MDEFLDGNLFVDEKTVGRYETGASSVRFFSLGIQKQGQMICIFVES